MFTHRVSLVFDVDTDPLNGETSMDAHRRLMIRAEHLLMEIVRPWDAAEPVLIQVDDRIRLMGGRLESELYENDPR